MRTTFVAPSGACTGCGNLAGSESWNVRPTVPGKRKSGGGSDCGVDDGCACRAAGPDVCTAAVRARASRKRDARFMEYMPSSLLAGAPCSFHAPETEMVR